MSVKLTTEEFIKQAKEVHGDKYDYSKVYYVNKDAKVCIICPEHGEFYQRAYDHLRGRGCSKCSGKHKYSTKEFIKRASEVHDNRYDYSKVEYKNKKTKVCIICPEHGAFWQIPESHLRGRGCSKCYGIGITTEEFIAKAKKIHGDKYDYSHVKYTGGTIPVEIICPAHGSFFQSPQSHLQGQGCPKCANKNITTGEWIKKAKLVHGDKYDYSKVEYKNAITPVEIICPAHGSFWQKPCVHAAMARGCPKCGIENNKMTQDEFIKKARDVHKDEYDYSLAKYVRSDEKVLIICKKHGVFKQAPHSHLRGAGCPKCRAGYHEIKFFKSEKIDILTQYDLLSMDWACILDLVSEDKLPKEFSQLATFAAGSKGRKKLIDELSKKYSIPEEEEHECDGSCGGDCHCHDGEDATEQKIATDDEIISATIPLPAEQTKHATTGGIMHEIDTIASIIQRGDKTTYSSGDKMKHIVAKELSKLWSQVLRDDENHTTETIEEINKQIK